MLQSSRTAIPLLPSVPKGSQASEDSLIAFPPCLTLSELVEIRVSVLSAEGRGVSYAWKGQKRSDSMEYACWDTSVNSKQNGDLRCKCAWKRSLVRTWITLKGHWQPHCGIYYFQWQMLLFSSKKPITSGSYGIWGSQFSPHKNGFLYYCVIYFL